MPDVGECQPRLRPGSDCFRWALGLALAAFCLSPFGATADFTNSWRVFRSLPSFATTGPNTLGNPGMETVGLPQPLGSWSAFGSGYTASSASVHSGTGSLQCTATNATEVHGGSQTIVLNQTTPKALRFSGWSKAQNVSGSSDGNYSVYLDILYTNGTPLWAQTLCFSVGTHDWEYRETFLMPALPIRQLNCYLLFRNSHTGTVWFDDITVAEVQNPVVSFDGSVVGSAPPAPLPFDSATRHTLLSGDGLQLAVTQDGGVIAALSDGTNHLLATAMDYASGWFVCDRAATSDWWSVGGWVTATNDALLQRGVITTLNLAAEVRYTVTNSAIRIQATVSNLVAPDRALSLYFALPADLEGGGWWNSPRERVSLADSFESATLTSAELGARNLVSQYPLATVAANAALTLAIPPDQYRPFRLAYNRLTRQFFAVFDLGLSAVTTNFPQSATAEVWFYRSDPAWGLRSGLDGFYRRFPGAFTRPFTNEGIWVAFADLHNITNLSDFGIGYHEIGYDPALVKFDDTQGIPSFRYVSEPWSYWMTMPTNVPNTDSTSVFNYLLSQHAQGVQAATATLSSGLRDSKGLLQFSPAAQPWCPYGAVFCVNSSPYLRDPQYSVTKFSHEWNSTVRDVYHHPEYGRLDGEYIDSFIAYATAPDYSSNHLRTTTFPLAYRRDNLTLMTPLMFGSYEMARAIATDVHALGKPIMANFLFTDWQGLPFGLGLFDFAGAEINCFDAAGAFVPPSDHSLLYARALSGARPYGYLLNTDFTKVSQAEMESYMRLCAVYAIYPSAFSATASTDNYFGQPALYERDRSLFKKYVPIVRSLSLAGWRPVTDATSDNANLALEAYGSNAVPGPRYLGVRNLASQATTANVRFDLGQWAYAGAPWLRLTNLFDGDSLTLDLVAGSNSAPLTLQANECRVYAVQVPVGPTVTLLSPTVATANIPAGVGLVLEAAVSAVRNQADLQVSWLQLGGPGSVTFGNPGAANTSALFSAPGTYELRLFATEGLSQSATRLTVNVGVAPDLWKATGIGTVPVAVGYLQANDTVTVTAGGAGIQSTGTADDFCFLDQAATGNAQITARIVSVQNVAGAASRAGVMMRETATRDAREIFMGLTSLGGGRLIWRSAPGSAGGSSTSLSTTLALPYWVRLTRLGNVFTASTAPDHAAEPGPWTQQGTPQIIVMSNVLRMGLAAASGSASTTGVAVVDHVTLSPAPYNTGPWVSAGAAQATTNATVALDGLASDEGLPHPPGQLTTRWSQATGPSGVAFHDASLPQSSVTFPEAGTYVLRLTATDGAVTTFNDTAVTVTFGTLSPPRITGFVPLAEGQFEFQLVGTLPGPCGVLVSTNLGNWDVLNFPLQASNGLYRFTDPAAPTSPQRFYRLRSPQARP